MTSILYVTRNNAAHKARFPQYHVRSTPAMSNDGVRKNDWNMMNFKGWATDDLLLSLVERRLPLQRYVNPSWYLGKRSLQPQATHTYANSFKWLHEAL